MTEIVNITQGTTLNFSAVLPQHPNLYKYVYAWVYTNENMPTKFSYTEKSGHLEIKDGNVTNEIVFTVPASVSKKYSGKLFLGVFFDDSELTNEDIGNTTKETQIMITKSPISAEV